MTKQDQSEDGFEFEFEFSFSFVTWQRRMHMCVAPHAQTSRWLAAADFNRTDVFVWVCGGVSSVLTDRAVSCDASNHFGPGFSVAVTFWHSLACPLLSSTSLSCGQDRLTDMQHAGLAIAAPAVAPVRSPPRILVFFSVS